MYPQSYLKGLWVKAKMQSKKVAPKMPDFWVAFLEFLSDLRKQDGLLKLYLTPVRSILNFSPCTKLAVHYKT